MLDYLTENTFHCIKKNGRITCFRPLNDSYHLTSNRNKANYYYFECSNEQFIKGKGALYE